MTAPAPTRSKPVNDDPRLARVTEPQGRNAPHQTLDREKDTPEREVSPLGQYLSPSTAVWSPSLWSVMSRVRALPSADFLYDAQADAIVILAANGAFIIDIIDIPSGDGEPVRVAALRKLAADAAPDEFELPYVGEEVAHRLLTEKVTDWEPGEQPQFVAMQPAVAEGVELDLSDENDPLAQALREAADEAREGTLDRAVDDDADAAQEFMRIWEEKMPDMPLPVAASGAQGPRLSQFCKVDTASLAAIRRELDAFSSDTISARTSQRAVGIKLKVRDALVASGLGQAEVEWVEAAYSAGARSAHTRGGAGVVGEVVGGTYVAVDTALALTAASLRSREQARQVLGIRRVSR